MAQATRALRDPPARHASGHVVLDGARAPSYPSWSTLIDDIPAPAPQVLAPSKALKVPASGPAPSPSSSLRTLCTVPRAIAADVATASAMTAEEKLSSLREGMKAAGVYAYIVPSEDPHMSEYAPAHQGRREFISGFTGSAGTVLVTLDSAMLWTDGRYFLQASTELAPCWTLMKGGTKGVPTLQDWLVQHVPAGGKVGIDAFVHTQAEAEGLAAALEDAGKSLVAVDGNLVDAVWGSDRPAAPTAPLRVHALKWAGETAQDKVKRVFADAEARGTDAMLVTALDEVGWLLNLRGSDVSFNPVFLSYVIVDQGRATLYVDQGKLTPEVKEHLAAAGVAVKDYDLAIEDVAALAAGGKKILADPKKVSYAFAKAAETRPAAPKKAKLSSPSTALVKGNSPVTLAKGVKNDDELAGMREAHLRDAVALAKFFHWLEVEVGRGTALDEVIISDKLLGLRQEQEGFIEPSFPTIAGADANGAIIHYRPVPGPNNKSINGSTMLLVDSGGQYDCGTTDVTRTVHFGEPTQKQISSFTAVLRGHIALDQAVFPEGTPGFFLDTLARAPVWALGLNYRHGTGHGVGAAMNVHEGPQSISQRYHIDQGLMDRMVCSNEPGYYEDGAFGIRIENLVIVKETKTQYQFDPDTKNLGFERLTLHPLQHKLIDFNMLTPAEVEWLLVYHQEVWEKVSPRLSGDTLEWLRKQCAQFGVFC